MNAPLIRIIKRRRGVALPVGAVYVGRPGPLGNPFRAESKSAEDVEAACEQFELGLNEDVSGLVSDRRRRDKALAALRVLRNELRDTGSLTLACWCIEKDIRHSSECGFACHAERIAYILLTELEAGR